MNTKLLGVNESECRYLTQIVADKVEATNRVYERLYQIQYNYF